jgi:type IV pilus assembly protein PilY1
MKIKNKIKKMKSIINSTLLSTIVFSPFAFSDDIEIYTGSTDKETSVNIMFMLDTSGSMSYGVPGTRDSRMDQAKEALKAVINDLPGDMKVGLGRFNTPGGSILYPSKRLDDKVGQEVGLIPRTNEDDAYEKGSGDKETFVYSEELYFSPNKKNAYKKISSREDDAEQCPNGSGFLWDNQYAGITIDGSGCFELNAFLFRNLNIPKNAEIMSAIMELTTESGAWSVGANVFIENDSDPLRYNSKKIINDGRSYLGTSRYWEMKPTNKGQKVYSPDLKDLVQSVVNRSDWVSGDNGLAFKLESDIRYGYNTYYTATSSSSENHPVLRVTYRDNNIKQNIVGIKFGEIAAPSGSTVTEGLLKLTASQNNGSGSLTIKLEDGKNNESYKEENQNISNRTPRSEQLIIEFTDWNAGEDRFFDVSSLLQSKFNNLGWCGGGDVNFLITSEDANAVYAREAGDENNSFALAPSLQLEYEGGDDSSCLSFDRIIQINDYADDSHEDSKNYKNKPYNSKIVMKGKGGIGGFIFRDINIPAGSKIKEAYMQFTVAGGVDDDDWFDIRINEVSPYSYPIPEFKSNKYHLSYNRGTLSSTKYWSIGNLSKNDVIQTVPLTDIVQNRINSASYASATNKDIEFRVTNNSWSSGMQFNVFSYDDNPGKVAKLIIRYEGSSGVNTTSVSTRSVSGSDSSPLTVRQHLLNLIDVQPTNGGTPMEGALYEAGAYFLGDPLSYGRSRNESQTSSGEVKENRISGEETYTGGTIQYPNGCSANNLSDSDCSDIYISGNPIYNSPFTDNVCESNNIILITDGEPSSSGTSSSYYRSSFWDYNGTTLSSLIRNKTGFTCDEAWECMNIWASYMYNTDFMPSKNGKSNIITHTIGYANLDTRVELQQLAGQGGGTFVTAGNTEELVNALNLVISNIMEIESTLATPGVAVNQNNRTQHLSEVYYSVFKPSVEKGWLGNLKKYEIDGLTERIVDSKGENAVDEETGFFKEGTTSFWSTEVDGGDVTKGGAASKQTLSRKVYTYTSSSVPSEVDLTNPENVVNSSNLNLTKSHFGLSSSFSDVEFKSLVDWVSGIDVFDENFNSVYTDARESMGDPLHSRPILVSYSDTENYVFVSTNEGYLHAIDSATGEEKFSFIPKELLPNSYTRYVGGSGNHIYGLDGSWVAWRKDVNKDGIIKKEDGDHVYIYSGMRRGGDYLYALDVTDIDKPILKFMKSPYYSGFEDMGQTWSEPVLGRIKHNGVEKIALIVTGGYDLAYDNSNYTDLQDSLGSYLYFIDAKTGDLIYSISGNSGSGDLKVTGMEYSIVSKPTILDLDSDGYLDRIYLTDLSSQIIKIKLNEENTGSNMAEGKIIAKLGKSTGSVDLPNVRMMYDSIAVAPIKDQGKKYMAIIGGTGYRAHPLDKTRQDMIFMIKDKEDFYEVGGQKMINSPILLSDLADVTTTTNSENASALVSVKDGYYIQLKDNNVNIGEKVTGEPVVYNNDIYLNTYVPNEVEGECVPVVGYTRGYKMDVRNGSPDKDLNGDGIINEEDRYDDNISSGITNGSKIIYTEDGVFLLTNTKVKKIGENGDLGVFKKRWYIEKGQ